MPGRLYLERSTAEIAAWLGAVGDAPGQGQDIAPGDAILVCDADLRLRPMRWGMILSGRVNARRRPVMETIVNARSETLSSKSAFLGVKRGLVPADGWYEWTGATRRKTRWRIRSVDGDPLAFAAIWDAWEAPGGVVVNQVATVTCAPNKDVKAIHHRMGVLLPKTLWEGWLSGAEIPMEPAPDGSLHVEDASDIDR